MEAVKLLAIEKLGLDLKIDKSLAMVKIIKEELDKQKKICQSV